MSVRALDVLRPGLLTTVQDGGRWGQQALGVPVAGAMDTASLRHANLLVGNPAGAAGLEVTLLGPRLRAEAPLLVAVAGAPFELDVDGRPQAMDTPFVLGAGTVLTFGRREIGARAYLAVAGGIDVPLVLGSRATHLVSRMGGLEGRALKAGDRLPLGPAPGIQSHRAAAGPAAHWLGPGPHGLRVLPGPQDDWFTDASRHAFFTTPFTVSPRSDRMGFRLDGPAIVRAHADELLSEPVPFGAVQVPAGGAPILLMADRQTAGGYPKIATVIAADLPVAGQLGPGDQIRFIPCTRADAVAALIARERVQLRTAAALERA